MPLMTKRYYSVDGEILGDSDAGDYMRDALGSVTATCNPDTGSVWNTYRYKPYGSDLSSSGGEKPDPKFRWVGTAGYRQTSISHSASYVRARHYGQEEGRWTTVDPVYARDAYIYVTLNPILYYDRTGLEISPVGDCRQNIKDFCEALKRILDPKSGKRNQISKCIGASRESLDPLFDYLRSACQKNGKRVCIFCSPTAPRGWPAKECGEYCQSGHASGTGQTILPTPIPVISGDRIDLPVMKGRPDTEPNFCYKPPRPTWAADCLDALQRSFPKFDFNSCDCIAAICRRNENPESQWTLYHELTHCAGLEGSIHHNQGKDLPYRMACCICRAINEGEGQYDACRLVCKGVPTF